MFYKPCNDYYICGNANKSCLICKRNIMITDHLQIKKFNFDFYNLNDEVGVVYKNPCDVCPNRPKNGEMKTCNCTLPYINNNIY